MKGTVALYMRLSSEDANAKESGSISNQRDLLYHFVRNRREFDNCPVLEFCDDGFSGTNFERPQIQRLLTLARQGKVSCILVKDLSRFGRNYLEAGTYLEQIFPFLGVRFIAVNDGYDSDSYAKSGEFLETAFRNLAYDLYSRDLSQKVSSVRRVKAMQGKCIAASAPYGYRKSPEQRLLVDEETAPVVRRIFLLAAEQISKAQIARTLNQEQIPAPMMIKKQRGDTACWGQVNEKSVWNAASISRILKDQRYAGDAVYGKEKPVSVGSRKSRPVSEKEWIIVPDNHEPIISRELYEKVNAMFKKRPYKKGEPPLFAGKVRCGVCNHLISRKHGAYRCRLPEVTDEYTCYTGTVKEEQLAEIVLTCLQNLYRLAADTETAEKLEKARQKKITLLKKELSERSTKNMQMKNARFAGYEEYKKGLLSREQFIKRRKEIKEQQNNELQKLLQSGITEEVSKYALFQTLTREITETFVEQIIITQTGRLNIEWRFRDLSLIEQPGMFQGWRKKP